MPIDKPEKGGQQPALVLGRAGTNPGADHLGRTALELYRAAVHLVAPADRIGLLAADAEIGAASTFPDRRLLGDQRPIETHPLMRHDLDELHGRLPPNAESLPVKNIRPGTRPSRTAACHPRFCWQRRGGGPAKPPPPHRRGGGPRSRLSGKTALFSAPLGGGNPTQAPVGARPPPAARRSPALVCARCRQGTTRSSGRCPTSRG